MRVLRPVAAVVASTLLLTLLARSTPATAWLGFVALVPWVWALEAGASWRSDLLLSAGLAVGFVVGPLGWFPGALAGFAGMPPAVAWVALVILAPVLEPQTLAFALTRRALASGPRPRALVAASLAYVGVEWAWPKLLDDTLAYGLLPFTRLRQVADLGGARGLTLVLLLVNVALLLALAPAAGRNPSARLRVRERLVPLGSAAALLLVATLYGELRLRTLASLPALTPITVGVVQADFTAYEKRAAEVGRLAVVEEVLSRHFALSDALLASARPDLVIWPETVYPTTYGSPQSDEGAALDRAVAGWVAARKMPLLFGAYEREADAEFNAAVLLRPAGEQRVEKLESYRKSLLFPLTEHVPAAIDAPWLRALLPWTGRWRPGPGPATLALDTPGGTLLAAPLVCYEALSTSYAAAGVARGASLLITLSNDAWFAGTAGPRLHLCAAAFRSIETRRPQVRATTTGISAFIDASGEVLAETEDQTPATLTRQLWPTAAGRSLVVRLGDWVGPTSLGLALLAMTQVLTRSRRRGEKP